MKITFQDAKNKDIHVTHDNAIIPVVGDWVRPYLMGLYEVIEREIEYGPDGNIVDVTLQVA